MAGLAATAGFDQIVPCLDSLAVAAGTAPTAGESVRLSDGQGRFDRWWEWVEKPADGTVGRNSETYRAGGGLRFANPRYAL
jgi:hypothetical protein